MTLGSTGLPLPHPRLQLGHPGEVGSPLTGLPFQAPLQAGKKGKACGVLAWLYSKWLRSLSRSLSLPRFLRLLLIRLLLQHKREAPEHSSPALPSQPPRSLWPDTAVDHLRQTPPSRPPSLNFKTTRQCASNTLGQDIKRRRFLQFPRITRTIKGGGGCSGCISALR